jgi:prepilin-type N-terminal cleavage/methylation domain-containing protein
LKPSDDRGFTLIEVLIAMIVLTVALVSLAELMAITLRMQMLGRNQTAAIRLAQDKVDELMNQNFNTSPLVAIGGSLTADVANHFDAPSPLYKRRWVVAAGPADPDVVAAAALVPPQAVLPRLLTVRIIPLVTDNRSSISTEITTVIRCWPCT